MDEKFWGKVDKTGDCWIWTGAVQKRWGYGWVMRRKRPMLTHRWAWILENGEIPDGLCVLHTCDNPPCVNPDHLFLGTHQDNMDDMNKKGRHGTTGVKGSKHSQAKLTECDVKAILGLAKLGIRQRLIAEAFNINQTNVSLIVTRKAWSHVESF